MPAYRVADYDFLARLDASELLTGEAGRPGQPFDRPSLILAGRQDVMVGYRGALGLVEEFPRATCALLDLAGHHLGRVEQPALFGALVEDWLERMATAG
jgi:pimeloyl-ACP methyl ester carboxylesterase